MISAFSSSVPTARMTLATISVVLMAMIGASALVSSSSRMCASKGPSGSWPSSRSQSAPTQPRSASRRTKVGSCETPLR